MIVIACGFLLDFMFGDPYFMPHPVKWIGSLISALEKIFRKYAHSNKMLKISGFLIAAAVVLLTAFVSFGLVYVCSKINIALAVFVNIAMCYYALAMRCLKSESMKVYNQLKMGDIEKSRYAVSMIVGRDTQNLDFDGVARAVVETVAENTSDGVIAPLFYMMIGLGPLAMVYKAINTMDSMLGYKNEKYFYIGYACAKLDDIANYIPSRLSALFMTAASIILRYDYKNAFKIWLRDSRKHASPNSAQTESVCAGALNIRLAGDAFYFGELHKKPVIGDDIRNIEFEDIKRCNNIMFLSAFLFLIAGLLLRGVVIWLWF